MTNALSKARKRLFAHDPDVRPYAAADTVFDDDDEYVPEHTEDERADADRRKVSLILFFFPTPTHALASGGGPLLPSPPFPFPSHPFIRRRHCSPLPHVHTQRDIPPGLSERDAAILHAVKRRASVLDKHFKFCGAQFGWSFIVGMPLPPPTPVARSHTHMLFAMP